MISTASFDARAFRQGKRIDLQKLQQDAPTIPRYLIRVHSLASQGLMAKDSFISAAELSASKRNTSPPSIKDYDPKTFERHTHNHLTNYKGTVAQPFLSPFISLTVSLRTALAWAKMRSRWGHRDVRIAVLDTTTISDANCDCGYFCRNAFHQNPVWPANMVYKACRGKGKDYPDEFLAFGHLRGTFKVCTYAELETNFLVQYLPELAQLPKSQRYEDLPATLRELWAVEQPLHPSQKELVIHIAEQLSNDALLIPMVAFVLCVRKRSPVDKHVLDTVVRVARQVEKQAMYDFLGYYDAFPVFDFFSKKQGQRIIAADSTELLQTSEVLERVKLAFAETQEKEAHKMWNCTTVALISKSFCSSKIGNMISISSLRSRRSLTTDITRAFARLQTAVFRSKVGGLRLLRNELAEANRNFDLDLGLLTPISVKKESDHEFWTRTFGEIATRIESIDDNSMVFRETPEFSFSRPIHKKEDNTSTGIETVSKKIKFAVNTEPEATTVVHSAALKPLRASANSISRLTSDKTQKPVEFHNVGNQKQSSTIQARASMRKENAATQ